MDTRIMNILNNMESRHEEEVKVAPITNSVGFETKILEALSLSEKKKCEAEEIEKEEVLEEVKEEKEEQEVIEEVTEVEEEEVITESKDVEVEGEEVIEESEEVEEEKLEESVVASGIEGQDLVEDPGIAGVNGEVVNSEEEVIEEDFVSRCLECGATYKGDAERCIQCGSTDTEIFGEIFIGGDVEIDEELEEVEEMDILIDGPVEEVETEDVLVESKRSRLDLSAIKTKEDAIRVLEALFSQGTIEASNDAIDVIFDFKLSQKEVQDALDRCKKHKKGGKVQEGTEITESTKKVVKGGKVVKVKVKTKKTKLTPDQKKALANARKKAHTPDAEKARQKSMKIRSKKLKEFYSPEDYQFNVTVMVNNKPLTTNHELFDIAEDDLGNLNITDWGTHEIYCSSKSVGIDIAKALVKHAKEEFKSKSFSVEVAEGDKVVKVLKESVEVSVNESFTKVLKINESLESTERPGILLISENADRLATIAEANGFVAQEDGSFLRLHESDNIVLDVADGDMSGVVLYATDDANCIYSQADLEEVLTEAKLNVQDKVQVVYESVSLKRRTKLDK